MDDPALVSYVSGQDIDVVLERIPAELRTRLRDVFESSRSYGVRRLGAVRTRGRRDIELFDRLPPRVSLRRFIYPGSSAIEFGAPRQGQWPPWAVRRFLLYDVLLHELGHLQLVRPQGRGWTRKYASETLAQEFADSWRRELYSQPFDHPDPVHNPPSEIELGALSLWERLDKAAKERLVHLVLAAPHPSLPDLSPFGTIEPPHLEFVHKVLGVTVQGQ